MKNNNSPMTGVRLNKDDQRELKFVQEKLSTPGARMTKAETLRRALYAFANMLRSQESNQQDKSSKSRTN